MAKGKTQKRKINDNQKKKNKHNKRLVHTFEA